VKYRKKPVVIEAAQWHKNGDHPQDGVGELVKDPVIGEPYQRIEGAVVRFFRRPEPEYQGDVIHSKCNKCYHDHGWIDTRGGHTVCPGDWIITGVQGEFYPYKPDIFEATYEPVDESELVPTTS
jgi:hypothetical protein